MEASSGLQSAVVSLGPRCVRCCGVVEPATTATTTSSDAAWDHEPGLLLKSPKHQHLGPDLHTESSTVVVINSLIFYQQSCETHCSRITLILTVLLLCCCWRLCNNTVCVSVPGQGQSQTDTDGAELRHQTLINHCSSALYRMYYPYFDVQLTFLHPLHWLVNLFKFFDIRRIMWMHQRHWIISTINID